MKILVSLDLDINIARWADVLGFQIVEDKVVSDNCTYTLENFEECIKEYIRISMYLQEKGKAICGTFMTCPAEQEDFRDMLESNFEEIA